MAVSFTSVLVYGYLWLDFSHNYGREIDVFPHERLLKSVVTLDIRMQMPTTQL